MLPFDYNESEDMWTLLKNTEKPIVMYGTGDGADKILRIFSEHEIQISDIFVSDEFYRGKEFHDFKTYRYSDISEKYDDFIIVLAFAVFRDDMISYVKELMKRHIVIAPYVPVFGNVFFDMNFVNNNSDKIQEAYTCLEDNISKETFKNIFMYRISGNPQYLFDCESNRKDVLDNIIKLGLHEKYVDLGAYRGDTIEEFLKITDSEFDGILALEPDIKNYKKCIEYINSLPEDIKIKIRVLNMASWDKKDILKFDGEGGRNSTLVPQKVKKITAVEATDLDSVLNGELCSFVKMDVEGAEAETLNGMKNTICACKPKLIVSAYHKTPDIFELPLLIKSLCGDYKIFLRHHTYIPDWETNYYCI